MLPNGPVDLPDFRFWMIRQWEPGGLYREVADRLRAHRDRLPLPGPLTLHPEYGVVDPEFELQVLPQASLWWVAEDMCDLITAAAPSLPSTTLTRELLPTPAGLVYFTRSLVGTDTITETELTVDVMVWGPVALRSTMKTHLTIATYGIRTDMDQEQLLVPLGRTDWRPNTDTDVPVWPELEGQEVRNQSMAEDRRWLATLWLLADDKQAITHTSTVTIPRAVARRSQRAKMDPQVRLVNVRRAVAEAGMRTIDAGDRRPFDHRWIVGGAEGGFWRQQAYGPGYSLHKPKWIFPFIKGPKGAPLRLKEKVNVVKTNRNDRLLP